MARVLSLDTGHMTDEELGIAGSIDRQMRELPCARNERVKATRNGNCIIPKAR